MDKLLADETPEMENLKTIYRVLGGTATHEKFKPFKEELAELIINEFKEQARGSAADDN